MSKWITQIRKDRMFFLIRVIRVDLRPHPYVLIRRGRFCSDSELAAGRSVEVFAGRISCNDHDRDAGVTCRVVAKGHFPAKARLRCVADGMYLPDRRARFTGDLLGSIACFVSHGGGDIRSRWRMLSLLARLSRQRPARIRRLDPLHDRNRHRQSCVVRFWRGYGIFWLVWAVLITFGIQTG